MKNYKDTGFKADFLEALIEDLKIEDGKQIRKWGLQNHNLHTWLAYTTEEFGEAAQALNEYIFKNTEETLEALSEELVQTITLLAKILQMVYSDSKLSYTASMPKKVKDAFEVTFIKAHTLICPHCGKKKLVFIPYTGCGTRARCENCGMYTDVSSYGRPLTDL